MLLIFLCPTEWAAETPKTVGLWRIQIGLNTVFFPLLVVALLRALNFIPNFQMRDTRERLAPMMAIMLFYFWNFYVFHKLTHTPLVFRSFLLSTFVSISVLFVITIFAKVSLHVAGVSGALTLLCIQALGGGCIGTPVLVAALVLVVATSWARYTLREHTKAELILGLLVGALCQLGTYAIYR
jgi:hypothetical protein